MRSKALVLCLLIAITTTALAGPPADGRIDTNWGVSNSGRSVVAFDVDAANPVDVAYAAVPDSQGRTYLVGTVSTPSGDRIGITRLLRDGTIDTGYGDDGKVVGTYPSTGVAAALDAEGDLLVGGNRPFTGDDTDFAVCRFDANGNPVAFTGNGEGDTCVTVPFNVGGENKDTLRDMIVQRNGQIVLVGDAKSSSTSVQGAVARLDADGTLDAGFGSNGTLTVHTPGQDVIRFKAIALQLNNKIVLAGESVATGKTDRDAILARLTSAGQLDQSFADGAGVDIYGGCDGCNNFFNDLVLEPDIDNDANLDNAIYAAGGSETAPKSRRYDGWAIGVIRIGGLLVAPFGNNGEWHANPGESLVYRSIHRQQDGSMILVGSGSSAPNTDEDFYVTRVDSYGKIDPDFNSPAGTTVIDVLQNGSRDTAYAMAVHPDRFIIAGSTVSGSGPTNLDYAGVALIRDRIFADGFKQHL